MFHLVWWPYLAVFVQGLFLALCPKFTPGRVGDPMGYQRSAMYKASALPATLLLKPYFFFKDMIHVFIRYLLSYIN